MKPHLIVLLLTAATGAIVASWVNLAGAARMRTATAELAGKRDTLAAELSVAASHRRSDAAANGSPVVHTIPHGSTDRSSDPRAKSSPDASTLMASNPELRDLFQRYSQAELGFQFRPFYHAANLSPERISRFQALILEQRQEQMDLESASAASGLEKTDAARLRKEQEQRHAAEQSRLLGEEDYAKYREFTRVQPMEGAVVSVATLGAETGEPLTEAQGERLLAVLANASESYRRGGDANLWTLDLPQLLEQARPILSPHQFSVLQGSADLAQAFQLAKDYQIQHGYGATR